MTKIQWNELADRIIEQVARANEEFTPDAVWAAGLPKPEEARALGAAMTRAKNLKLIEKTGRVRPTAQPESHRTDVTVWRSLIYGQSS